MVSILSTSMPLAPHDFDSASTGLMSPTPVLGGRERDCDDHGVGEGMVVRAFVGVCVLLKGKGIEAVDGGEGYEWFAGRQVEARVV